MKRPARWSRVQRVGRALLLAVVAFGCGDSDRLKTHAVRGQVLVDGKPAEHAALVFHPAGGDEKLKKLTPRATTDKNGFYELKTYWSGDGAPLGDYKVTAVWWGPLPPNAESEGFNVDVHRDQPDRLKGKYATPEKSGLTVTIQGPGDLPPLSLTTK